jgi:hypothetical protein
MSVQQFEDQGFTTLNNVVNDEVVRDLIVDLPTASDPQTDSSSHAGDLGGDDARLGGISPPPQRNLRYKKRRNQVYGMRDLLHMMPSVQDLLASITIQAILEPILGEPHLIRGLFFDKLPEANWGVDWHQDLTIAVRNRIDLAGFSAWSIKSGIPHVIPPTEILERILILRIHLDQADALNGALQVIPGSHRYGRLTDAEIDNWAQSSTPVICSAPQGSVLLMRPLLLHSSSASVNPRHRRILHIEFSPDRLPGGLEWYGA